MLIGASFRRCPVWSVHKTGVFGILRTRRSPVPFTQQEIISRLPRRARGKSRPIYKHIRATRRCRPKVTRIGMHGLLHSRSAMPWRLARDLISVVSRTELAARGKSVSYECKVALLEKARVARPGTLKDLSVNFLGS